ncbi:hypothetical protein [Frigoriglobus tundricola]|uniref:Uncharacterized protein n=1 Tax=Frigoriglobus tundricola TaxID=2774151 RepID=A0A6M5Z3N6_9BACT|nr:hypothetical protein [Frigoriglobus tundricola]QJX01040.1 hypothetical protein FTUN_8678 [Frigoriglobus tundricola]
MFGIVSYLKARQRRHAVNTSSAASNPGRLRLSDAKLKRLCPSLFLTTGLGGFARCFFGDGLGTRMYVRDMLVHGDSRAAVVLSIDPVLVACYCDDSDAVCVLGFQKTELGDVELCVGDRLLTVLNSMALGRPARAGEVAGDLVQGDRANPHYINFWPLVAEFLTDDRDAIERPKAAITKEEYARCRALGQEHLRRLPGAVRDGRPDQSMRPVLGPLRGKGWFGW